MAKFLLKKTVTTASVWESSAESVSEAIKATESGHAKQIGWDQTETVIKVVSEALTEDRPLEEKRSKGFGNA